MAYRALSELLIYQTGCQTPGGMLVCVFALFRLFTPFLGDPSSQELIASLVLPVHLLILGKDEIIAGKSDAENDGGDSLKTVNPLLSLGALTSHIKHPVNMESTWRHEDEQTLTNILQKVLANMEWTWQWALIAKKNEWFCFKNLSSTQPSTLPHFLVEPRHGTKCSVVTLSNQLWATEVALWRGKKSIF